MSADNYMCVRRFGDQFVVTMEFASDDEPRPIRQRPDGTLDGGCTRSFEEYRDALDYAHSEWTEYGVSDLTGIDLLHEERQAFLAAISKLEMDLYGVTHTSKWGSGLRSWISDRDPNTHQKSGEPQ